MSGSRSILEICVCACVCVPRGRESDDATRVSEAFKIFLCARVSQSLQSLSYDAFVEWASRTCLFIYAFKHNLTRCALFSSVFFFSLSLSLSTSLISSLLLLSRSFVSS